MKSESESRFRVKVKVGKTEKKRKECVSGARARVRAHEGLLVLTLLGASHVGARTLLLANSKWQVGN